MLWTHAAKANTTLSNAFHILRLRQHVAEIVECDLVAYGNCLSTKKSNKKTRAIEFSQFNDRRLKSS